MSASPNTPWIHPAEPLNLPAKAPQEPPKPRVWPYFVAVALVFVAAAWYLRPQPKKAVGVSVSTVKVARGVIQKTRRISGSIGAGRFINIGAPVLQAPDTGRGLTLVFLAESGKRVKKGDLIAQIDAQDIQEHLVDVDSSIVQAKLDIARRKAQLVAQMEGLKQRLRVAKATMDRAAIDARTIPIRNAITQEILRLAADEYKEAYEEAVNQIPLTEERQLADIKLYELSYEHDLRHRDRHMRDFQACSIKSPMDGMVVMQTTYRGGQMNQIKVGDRLSPGQPFMRVVDPKSMLLDGTMSQVESEMIRLNQKATVRFDAFPEIIVRGHVKSVGALAAGGRRLNFNVRNVPIRLAIETVDPRVIPDLSASADVETAGPADGVLVPIEAVHGTGGKTLVYVKQGDNFVAREVEIGGSSNTHAAVVSGIQEGDEVALQPAIAASVIH